VEDEEEEETFHRRWSACSDCFQPPCLNDDVRPRGQALRRCHRHRRTDGTQNWRRRSIDPARARKRPHGVVVKFPAQRHFTRIVDAESERVRRHVVAQCELLFQFHDERVHSSVQRRKLNLKEKFESGSSRFKSAEIKRGHVNLGSTWSQPGSISGQPGVNLGSTGGQPGVNLGSTWGQPGVNLHRPTSGIGRQHHPSGVGGAHHERRRRRHDDRGRGWRCRRVELHALVAHALQIGTPTHNAHNVIIGCERGN